MAGFSLFFSRSGQLISEEVIRINDPNFKIRQDQTPECRRGVLLSIISYRPGTLKHSNFWLDWLQPQTSLTSRRVSQNWCWTDCCLFNARCQNFYSQSSRKVYLLNSFTDILKLNPNNKNNYWSNARVKQIFFWPIWLEDKITDSCQQQLSISLLLLFGHFCLNKRR